MISNGIWLELLLRASLSSLSRERWKVSNGCAVDEENVDQIVCPRI